MNNSGSLISYADQRRVLVTVSLAEFWELFSFFGTLSVLVLYTSKVFLFSDQTNYTIYSIYLALLCGLPVVGGVIVDKWLGYYSSLILGTLLLVIGNILIAIQSQFFLFLGLATTICGTCLYKNVCTSLVGVVYQNNSSSKDRAYTFFYAVLNCGAIIGPIVYGIVARYLGWSFCFLFSAFGLAVCFFWIIIQRNNLRNTIKNVAEGISGNRRLLGYSSVITLCFVVTLAFYLAQYFYIALFILIAFTLFIIYRSLAKQPIVSRRKLYGVIILLTFCIFFFAASLQVGSSLTLFLEKYVDRNIFGWNVPTTFFTSLDPLFVVLTAPIFTIIWLRLEKLRKNPTATTKLALGLLIGGLGFICFWSSVHLSATGNHYGVLIALLLGYIFIGAGEICLSPVVLSAISDFSPKEILSSMMGMWYFFMSIAGYLGGYIDKFVSFIDTKYYSLSNQSTSMISFSHIFIIIATMVIVAAVMLLFYSRSIDKLLSISINSNPVIQDKATNRTVS